ncbi:MAG: DNA repair protein RadC [Desulfohalobiaceae bacterium]|nr:DNA repair protein RadC [Desulfohalobiaceae bacterium]
MGHRPHYHGHRQRLRDRFLTDSRQLADYEILELLLAYALPRRDTKPLAKELLETFGSLAGVFAAKPHELRAIAGFGPGLETFWMLWQEFWARLNAGKVPQRKSIKSPREMIEAARARLGRDSLESFWVALVDNKNRLLSFTRGAQGTVDQSTVYPREILSLALEHKASGLILVHNHPGGDPSPSAQDKEVTREIQKSATGLGIRVLDHIIVSEDSWYSFQENGLL